MPRTDLEDKGLGLQGAGSGAGRDTSSKLFPALIHHSVLFERAEMHTSQTEVGVSRNFT